MPRWTTGVVAVVATALSSSPLLAASPVRVSGVYTLTDARGHAASWSVNTTAAAEREGMIPARLTRATAPVRTYACDAEGPAGGVSTVRVTGVAKPAARAHFSVNYSLRRGTALLTFAPVSGSAGDVRSQTVMACAAPFNGANGTDVSTHDVDLMVNGLATPRGWTMRRQSDGSWLASGVQRVRGQTLRANLRVGGRILLPGAGCRIPANAEMAHLRSFDAVKRFLVRDGFTRPGTQSRPSKTVPRGRFFILERARGYSIGICGARTINIVRSTGPRGGTSNWVR